jgi:hypothetical protein
MKTIGSLTAVSILALALAACTQDPCGAVGDVEFVCGPTNAEDLVLVPGTQWIIASGMAAGAGFTAIEATTGELRPLPVTSGYQGGMYPRACSAPPEASELESHGLDIHVADSGRITLHAVGHGAREAIEIYDVNVAPDGPSLVWKGCVPMPDGLAANSVASFSDGSLVATVLFMPGRTFADAVVDKQPTGAVFRWKLGDEGFTLIEGSALPANNGITVSADGSEIYVASSGLQTIVAFSNTDPMEQLRTSAPLPITPDNVHRGPDGKLLTAGMKNDVPECGGPPGPEHSIEILAACPRGSIAIEIDPATMADRVLVETPALKEFSNATMVLPAGGRYWFGTFSGDRVANVPMP